MLLETRRASLSHHQCHSHSGFPAGSLEQAGELHSVETLKTLAQGKLLMPWPPTAGEPGEEQSLAQLTPSPDTELTGSAGQGPLEIHVVHFGQLGNAGHHFLSGQLNHTRVQQ